MKFFQAIIMNLCYYLRSKIQAASMVENFEFPGICMNERESSSKQGKCLVLTELNEGKQSSTPAAILAVNIKTLI